MTPIALMILDNIAARLTGPMNFRFILQPLVAIFVLGIKDGRMDAKAGMPPFILDLVLHPEARKRDLKSAFQRLLVPVLLGAILDGIAQYLIFKHVRPAAAVLVGALVMGIPYALSRGITNRIVSARLKRAA
jgi:hypothetical protein